jgi:signal transduction histidine kinase
MVSHEFRTPLGIIMSSAEILERYLERLRPDQRVEHLQAIHKSVQRMAGMMEEVLVLGRVEAGKMECKPAPIDLVSFCQRLTDELHSATNRQCPIEFEASPLPEDAEADEGLLRHIFTNLLTNGVKYSRPGETVKFVLRYRDFQAVFTVEDKGVGIPEADQQWIFRAFHRGQNVGNLPGTGLGLTIVKRCVELHGGKIKCQSTEGVGTKFVVTLPLFGRPVNVGTETALFMNRP